MKRPALVRGPFALRGVSILGLSVSAAWRSCLRRRARSRIFLVLCRYSLAIGATSEVNRCRSSQRFSRHWRSSPAAWLSHPPLHPPSTGMAAAAVGTVGDGAAAAGALAPAGAGALPGPNMGLILIRKTRRQPAAMCAYASCAPDTGSSAARGAAGRHDIVPHGKEHRVAMRLEP